MKWLIEMLATIVIVGADAAHSIALGIPAARSIAPKAARSAAARKRAI
jgi:hypothetical protein